MVVGVHAGVGSSVPAKAWASSRFSLFIDWVEGVHQAVRRDDCALGRALGHFHPARLISRRMGPSTRLGGGPRARHVFNFTVGIVDFGAVSDSDGGLAEAAAQTTLRFECFRDAWCANVQGLKHDMSRAMRQNGDIARSAQTSGLLEYLGCQGRAEDIFAECDFPCIFGDGDDGDNL